MSRLSDLKNEEATALIADLIEPAAIIFADTEIKTALAESKMAGIKLCMKKHGKELIDILSIIDGIPREQYNVNAAQIVSKTLDILSDKDLMSAFFSQEQTAES